MVCTASILNTHSESMTAWLGGDTMLVTSQAAAVGILKPAEVRRDSSASHTTTAFVDLAPLCRVYNTSFFLPSIETSTSYWPRGLTASDSSHVLSLTGTC